jgi:hypothetical protein
MADSAAWFDADGTTPLSTLNLGIIPPGQDYITRNGSARQVVVKNTGDEALSSVTVELQQVGSYDSYTLAEIATGASPTYPDDYVDSATDPLALGGLAVGASANVWIQLTETIGAAALAGKAFNLALSWVV